MATNKRGPDDFKADMTSRGVRPSSPPAHVTPGDERYKQNILDRSLEAQRRIKGGQTWTDWIAIAEAVRLITDDVLVETGAPDIQADTFKKAFGKAWRKHESLVANEKNYREITRQEIHDLRTILDKPEIGAWRATLEQKRQRRLLHPRTVISAWKAAERKKPGEQSRRDADRSKPTGKEIATLTARLKEVEEERDARFDIVQGNPWGVAREIVGRDAYKARNLANAIFDELRRAEEAEETAFEASSEMPKPKRSKAAKPERVKGKPKRAPKPMPSPSTSKRPPEAEIVLVRKINAKLAKINAAKPAEEQWGVGLNLRYPDSPGRWQRVRVTTDLDEGAIPVTKVIEENIDLIKLAAELGIKT